MTGLIYLGNRVRFWNWETQTFIGELTVPGYPVFGTHAKYYGGQVHNLKLTAENHFLPDLKSVPADILAKADERNRKIEKLAMVNLDRAVAFVLERVIGKA